MLPLLRRGLYDFRMDFCDLIVSMEQAGIGPRPVVGVIVVVSGLAVSFLLWLLYVHHASANFAGRWMFLPALNALLNGLCAIALCAGFYFRRLFPDGGRQHGCFAIDASVQPVLGGPHGHPSQQAKERSGKLLFSRNLNSYDSLC